METKKFIGVLVGVILVLILGLGIGYYVGDSNKENAMSSPSTKMSEDHLKAYAEVLFNEVYIADGTYNFALWNPIANVFGQYEQSSKVTTYDNLSNDDKFVITMGNIKNIYYNVGNSGTVPSDISKCSMYYSISYDIFMETYHKIFGSTRDFKFASEGYYDANNNKCISDGSVIQCESQDIESTPSTFPYLVLDSVSEEGDSLILKVKGYFITDEERVHSYKEEHIMDHYNSSMRKADLDLVKKYSNLMDDYTLTFVKDTNGNYYFKELRLEN